MANNVSNIINYNTPMEALIRPFTPVISTPKPRVPTPPVEEQPEAFIEWGEPSEFNTDDSFREAASNPGFSVDDEEPTERVRQVFNEEGRNWTDFRVENPEDPGQYAIVRRVVEIAFRGPNGEQYLYRMRTDASTPGTEEGTGQEPPAPPDLEDIV
jgi:hypothetical protein